MSDSIKYYLDENIALAVAEGLRRQGIEALTTQQAGHLGAKDPQQLTLALSHEYVLVTGDRGFTLIDPSITPHTGIAYVPQGTPPGQIIKWLVAIAQIMSPQEMINRVEWFFNFD